MKKYLVCTLLVIGLFCHSFLHGQQANTIRFHNRDFKVKRPAANSFGSRTLASITFTRQSQIDSFHITNPTDTSFQDVIIDGTNANPAITRLDSLKYIREITGQLNVSHTNVTNLDGLTGLRRIGWILWLDGNYMLNTIKPPNITYINGLLLNELPLINTFSGFLNGLTNTRFDYFWLFNNVPITDFNGLQGIDSINHVGVFGLPNFQSFTGIDGFHYCESIDLFGCGQLNDVTAFSNITQLPYGSLNISYNGNLTSLDGLQNINYVAGVLTIQGTNYSSLSSAGLNPNLSIGWIFNSDTLTINDNPNLSVCNWPPLCNYLAAGYPAHIYNNAPGCDSVAEVQASCGTCTSVQLRTWNGSVSDDWNDAANWTPAGVPDICDSVVINNGTNITLNNPNTTIHALTMASGTSLFMNGNSLTVYGDVYLDNVDLSVGNVFTANNASSVYITNSTLSTQTLNLNYTGSLNFNYNIVSHSVPVNVTISDVASRTGSALLFGNNIQGSLSVYSYAINSSAQTYIATNDDETVSGDFILTINQPSDVQVGYYNNLHVGGNFSINNSTGQQPQIGAIDFNGGGGDVHVTQVGTTPIRIGTLSTNKFSGNIILDQDTYVDNNLTLGFGHIRTASNKLLILEPNALVNQTSSASWVWGPLRKLGLDGCYAFTMPVGDSIYRGECYIKNTTGCGIGRIGNDSTTGRSNNQVLSFPTNVTVQYFHKNPTSIGLDTALHQNTITSVSGNEYWKCTRDSGEGVIQVNLRYDPAVSQPTNSYYSVREAYWNGSLWQNYGANRIDSAGWTIVVPDSAAENMGYYTLGYNGNYHKPIITMGTMDTVACIGQGFKVRWTTDTLLFTANTFSVYISDSNGIFSWNGGAGYFLGSKQSRGSDSLQVYPYGLPVGNNYKVRVIGSQPADTSINTKTIKLTNVPMSNITVVGPTTACSQTPTKYYIGQPAINATGYTWYVSGGSYTQNADTITVLWNNPPYVGYQGSITAYAVNNCGTGNSAYLPVVITYPPPTTAPVLTNAGRRLYTTAPPANQNITINWYRNDTIISGATGTSYYASLAGTYTVRYATNCASGPVSNSISFAANSIPQTIDFPAITDKIYTDSAFVINATSSSGLPVEFTILIGPGNIPGNTFLITGTGQVTIKATQLGNDVYDTAAPVTRTFMVNKAPQTITFPAIADRVYSTIPFSVSASSNSGLAVNYSVVSGQATVNGNAITLTGVGTVTIRATQAGDTNFLAATPVDRSFCVKVPALNPISGSNSICPGVNVTYSVNNIPGATYTWRIAGGATLSSTTNTVTTSWPAPGNYTLIVSATGDCGAASPNDSLLITAITSVQPDSVHNMLPADGAINQQLPLNLSWIPANTNLYYTYDIYLWRSDSTQPSNPFVSGITTVNYTIPLNSGLSYNHTYKWMVVAHNGSCIQVNTGPIQQFTLIPLPDLQVYNVQAPATIFSGQTMTTTWSVKNNGPGNTQTNQSWTDAVYIATDSVLDFTNPAGQLQFPVVPKLVATVPNVAGLNNGQSYNSTANFTIPVNYSGPLYIHVVTNYNPPYTNPVIENNKANDTAHALPVTTVTLSPQPDFQVDTVFAPGNTFSGSTINLVYKVKNHGQAVANGSWQDKIYISKDPLFNPATATLLKYANGFNTYYPSIDAIVSKNGTVFPDSSYTVNVPVVIPNFIYGNYFVYVITNASNTIYEGANSNNNINHSPVMQVFLTATPKLVPLNVQVPANASNTQTLAINWSEANQGAYDNIEKNKGHYSVPSGTCDTCLAFGVDANGNTVCTRRIIGTRYRDSVSFGASYWVDRLYVSTDSTGLNLANATLIGDAPHGIQNSGYYVTDNFRSPQYCGDQLGGNQNTYPVLAPNTSFPSSYNYTLPDNFPQGNYYVYVYANATNSVYQYPGLPQITRSNRFTVVWPDLTVPSVNVPTTGNSGQPVTISYNLLNTGSGGLYNHYRKDYIYLGNNSSFDGTAVLIDSVVYASSSALPAVSQTLTKQTILPNGVSGQKYVFVKVNVDSSFKETSLLNNINTTGAPINIALTPPPNFTVSAITVNSPIYSSGGFPFKYTVTNVGGGIAAGNWKDSIFISCSSTFNSNTAYFVALRTQQSYVPVNGSYTDSFNLVIPQTYLINTNGCMNNDTLQPYFFVKTNANAGVYEPVTNNNILVSPQVTLINKTVDHVVSSVISGDSAFVGRNFKVSWSVKNIGLNPNDNTYNSWTDGIWLSQDSVLNNNAYYIGYKAENTRLNQNQSYTDSSVYTIPNMPAGLYYLLVKTNYYNQIQAERNLNNNLNLRRNGGNQPLKVYVSTPPSADLTDSILSVPSTVAAGQPFTIVYKVTNNGQGVTYSNQWNDIIWLSTNFQQGSIIAGNTQTRSLQPGQSYTDSFTITLPLNYTPGNYIVGVRTNFNQQLFETSYSNNTAYKFTSVYVPAPVDLLVSNINMADTVILGNTAAINYRLRNNSNNNTNGRETDGFYLSTDSLLDSNADVLLGVKNNILSILPLNDTSITAMPFISGVVEGSYYVKVKVDIQNNIPETNKNNNTGLLNKKVYVKVKQLFVNVLTPDTLTSNYLYYKLVVPTSLRGKTIMVQLTTPDSVTANNQMYIGLGYLPSAAHFDYVFSRPNYGNQQIVIETVLDSVYYIAAKGTKPNATYQLVTLQATVLPFTILTVNSNTGGNTGNVTVLLKGTLFRDSMTAKLRGISGNNIITASAVYFINSTMAYATFNLQGAPLGVYDVSLTKPDASVATLPSSFTVQVTNNGGLLTGAGSNTGQTGSGNAPGCDPGAASGLNAQLQTELVIPPKVFVGWPFQFQINYSNTTNVDIPVQVRTLYSHNGAPIALSQEGLAAGNTTLTIEFKNTSLPGNIIPAGSSGTITIWCKAPANAYAHEKIYFNLQ
jgi:hypothetical protein